MPSRTWWYVKFCIVDVGNDVLSAAQVLQLDINTFIRVPHDSNNHRNADFKYSLSHSDFQVTSGRVTMTVRVVRARVLYRRVRLLVVVVSRPYSIETP